MARLEDITAQVMVNRWLAIAVVCLLFTNVVTAGAFVAAYPFLRVEVIPIIADNAHNQIYHVEPSQRSVKSEDLISEILAKQYVTLRETIDAATESERFLSVNWFSSDEEWKRFFNGPARPEKGEIATLIKQGVRRSVEVVVCQRIESISKGFDKYRVEAKFIDTVGGSHNRTVPVEIILTVSYEAQKVRVEDRFINPRGFTVGGYSVRRKASS
ncbi:MAG: type IV secretion system protein [Rhodospirillales bacterium]|nr:type IV secretion system protein [Rhodospirillales bacterium]